MKNFQISEKLVQDVRMIIVKGIHPYVNAESIMSIIDSLNNLEEVKETKK